jgi:hypothetical protein
LASCAGDLGWVPIGPVRARAYLRAVSAARRECGGADVRSGVRRAPVTGLSAGACCVSVAARAGSDAVAAGASIPKWIGLLESAAAPDLAEKRSRYWFYRNLAQWLFNNGGQRMEMFYKCGLNSGCYSLETSNTKTAWQYIQNNYT